ncbi:NAD(P)-dependent oxidoreductase [Micromonospora matsumotoense]|uniref:NAD(P)-dependent oxidoreductase n=1 Tax=Micromonospora matsumotoense TaxID=121616 RepID=UPI003D9365F3
MSRVVVFGAGGRAGRAAVAEARRRGHQVTAVVRDPGAHGSLPTDGVRLVVGDATDLDSVAKVAAGHDAAISAVYDASARPDAFYPGVARALLDGLAAAEVGRLLVVGLAAALTTAQGVALMDSPGYPQEYRGFALAHAAGVQVLRAAPAGVDWLVVSPAGDFDHGGGRTGRYRATTADLASRISYPDLAVALIDEIDAPVHHRTQVGVETA